ncbi:MAG: hypothetical protein JNG86_10100 [Verrucomicrobiaceae bacterium]|nr:hypothetical protein [Verrucomicrobiaceae bacterium]
MLPKPSMRAFAVILLLLTMWAWMRLQPKVDIPALRSAPRQEPVQREPGAFPDE